MKDPVRKISVHVRKGIRTKHPGTVIDTRIYRYMILVDTCTIRVRGVTAFLENIGKDFSESMNFSGIVAV